MRSALKALVTRWLLVTAVTVLADVAIAADKVPQLNIEPSCRDAASQSLGAQTTLDGCLEQEASARRDLAARWPTADAADRNRCVSETTLGGMPSYVELLECIAMAVDARSLEKRDAERSRPPSTSGVGRE